MTTEKPKDAGVVVITGCSSGVGAATAAQLRRGGWTVYATARQLESMEALEQAGCRLLPLDVTDETSMQSTVSRPRREGLTS